MSRRARNLSPDYDCTALHIDGYICRARLIRSEYKYCPPHDKELKKLREKYKLLDGKFEASLIDDQPTVKEIKDKILLGEETARFRDQVTQRFFSSSANNRGHFQRVLWILHEVKQLRLKLKQKEAVATDDAPSELNQSTRVSNEMVEQIYQLFPALDDSSTIITDRANGIRRSPHAGDLMIRFVLLEFIMYRCYSEMGARAAQSQSIDRFLQESSNEDLGIVLRFFTSFRNGGLDVIHLLRLAIWDYLQDTPRMPITMMGTKVDKSDDRGRMTLQGWDILWTHFRKLICWYDLDQFAPSIKDLVLVKTAVACGRYRSGPQQGTDDVSWYDAEEDYAQVSLLALSHGFLAHGGGFNLLLMPVPSCCVGTGLYKERERRCYLVGRMSKNNEYVERLIQGLVEGFPTLKTMVYDRTNDPNMSSDPIVSTAEDGNLWIRRTRAGSTMEEMTAQPWMVEWSLNNVLAHLQMAAIHTQQHMATDYYEFIIIDSTPNREFTLLDTIAGILFNIGGYLSSLEMLHSAIRRSIPQEEQQHYIETFRYSLL